MSVADKTGEIDEAVWQAWLEKNRAQDKLRYERRLRLAGVAILILLAGAVLWRMAS
jgi:hypothetical protein